MDLQVLVRGSYDVCPSHVEYLGCVLVHTRALGTALFPSMANVSFLPCLHQTCGGKNKPLDLNLVRQKDREKASYKHF